MGQSPHALTRNPVLAVCVALGLVAAWTLPFVRVAPNRLLSGEAVFLVDLLPAPGLVGVALALAALVWAVLNPQHRTTQSLVSVGMGALLALLWALAAAHASAVVQAESALHRTALGAGFWCLVAIAWLACLDAVSRLGLKPLPRLAVLALTTLPLLTLIALGWGQDLSIMKEYANRSDVFSAAVLRHLQIVVLSVLPAVLLGLPLAWAMARTQRLRQVIFPVLNVIQTLPSIAVFGLLMAPLAWLASSYPTLARAGISGVGLAPAVLALVLYSLLPIARSALAGLEQVPVAATTAARAMGMDAWQLFWQVQLPLALPVLLVGLRTAVVQTIGLAAVTALVGAGGLGALMFDGLFSAANELVMLGVLPIVLMAVLADAAFKALAALLESHHG
jgi:osmoprotectant transport system permease protein